MEKVQDVQTEEGTRRARKDLEQGKDICPLDRQKV
jgi:hypothetical protein